MYGSASSTALCDMENWSYVSVSMKTTSSPES